MHADFAKYTLYGGGVTHIAFKSRGYSASRRYARRNGVHLVLRTPEQHDFCALAAEIFRELRAQALSGSGHDNEFVLESQGFPSFARHVRVFFQDRCAAQAV
jgi:hypothetical protein